MEKKERLIISGITRKKRLKEAPLFPELGRVPPQATELEVYVLACIMRDYLSPHVQKVMYTFNPEIFYKFEHQLIAGAILRLHQKSIIPDLTTISQELKQSNELDLTGGPYYITSIESTFSHSANIEYSYLILYQKYMSRVLIQKSSEVIRDSYTESMDIFEAIDKYIEDLENAKPGRIFAQSSKAIQLVADFEQQMFGATDELSEGIFFKTYPTGYKRLDNVVSFARDRLILIAGGAKHAKTKLVSRLVFNLLERFVSDIAVYWVTLEDSKYDMLCSYLASKIFYKPKEIKDRKVPKKYTPEIKHYLSEFKKFDIEFKDTPTTAREASERFQRFCATRESKLCILIFDNVMSSADRNEFRHDLNGMYDWIMSQMSEARSKTKQLIMVLHHYNDAQQDPDGKEKAYRPRLKDIKGTEAFRRVPTQVLMINYFKMYKDLVLEYSGDQRELINYMYVIDAGANREEDSADEISLIHYFFNANFTLMEEVEMPELEKQEDESGPRKDDDVTPI